jgi:UDP-glucuronate 4-epimerase
MKVLVTGTAGFIGYHLVKRLVQNAANEVVGLDNINNYYDPALKYARLKDTGIEKDEIKEWIPQQSRSYPNYRFVKMDLTDKENLNKFFAGSVDSDFSKIIDLKLAL